MKKKTKKSLKDLKAKAKELKEDLEEKVTGGSDIEEYLFGTGKKVAGHNEDVWANNDPGDSLMKP